jgi:hypothetical protein
VSQVHAVRVFKFSCITNTLSSQSLEVYLTQVVSVK